MTELSVGVRFLFCAECGIAFGVPEALFVARSADAGAAAVAAPIHCPNGHANAPAPDLATAAAARLVELAELATLRARLKAAELRLAELEPAGEALTDKEVKRRCNLLAEYAEPRPFGRKLCRFCGKPRSGTSLARHFYAAHRDEVRALGAEVFQ